MEIVWVVCLNIFWILKIFVFFKVVQNYMEGVLIVMLLNVINVKWIISTYQRFKNVF
jgi:hypothetical protein